MALQTSGEITLLDVATEFDDAAPHEMSEFYGVSSGVPTSGEITLSDFYGATASFYNGVIDGSARTGSASTGDYLTWMKSSAGNRQKWTWSGWLKRSNIGNTFCGITHDGDGATGFRVRFYQDQLNIRQDTSNSKNYELLSNAKYRDPSAWYHIVISVDTTQATASNRIKVYVNGDQVTSWSVETYPSQNSNTNFNIADEFKVGGGYYGALGGYIAEVHFIDGTALAATTFGESKNGCWIPKAASGLTYGTNGYYLDFGTSLTADQSGNGNNFTANNMGSTDLVLDTPENNFATWNKLADWNQSHNYYEGNLKLDGGGSQARAYSSIAMSSGKWYAEFNWTSKGSNHAFGIRNTDETNYAIIDSYDGTVLGGSGSGTAPTTGVIGIAVNADSKTFTVYQNNSAILTNQSYSGWSNTEVVFDLQKTTSSGSDTIYANFGQDSSFAGTKTAQGNTDANGYGDFYYAPPSGYLALCTANLPVATAVDPFAGNSPQDYFGFVSWAGNGASPRSITGMGIAPDMVYLGQLTSNGDPRFFVDELRQSGGELLTFRGSDTNSETTNEDHYSVFSLDSDGVTVGAGNSTTGGINYSGRTYGAWGWKAAGNSGTTNTNGSITSTVSASTGSGFSIVKWTGNLTNNATVGHGLNEAPQVIIIKNRNDNEHIPVNYLRTNGNWEALLLNYDYGTSSQSMNKPTSSVFYTCNDNSCNGSGDNMLAYCFHSVDGFSKIGGYTGNGSSDGTFVYTGFRPAFVLVKNLASGYDWNIYTAARDPYNPADSWVGINTTSTEQTGSAYLDIVSNGFKWRYSGAQNGSGSSYFFMAFAENPFKYANAR